MNEPASEAQERLIGLYEENAAAWTEARAGSKLEKPWLERFAELLPQDGEVLDVGCGSGEPVGRFLADRGFALTGVDSAPSLIAVCRERLPDHRWLVADMRELDLGRSFDAIVAWHSLFHLPTEHQRAMFQRFAAHTNPGGVLMFTAGHAEGVRIGDWQGEPLYHASLAPAEYDALLEVNCFDLIERRLRDPHCGEASVWLARRAVP